MNARRTFLKQSALITAGLTMGPTEFLKDQTKIGIQLYTLRDEISKDPKGVIGRIAAAGYKEVETFGLSNDTHFYGLTVKEFAELLKVNGLTCPSGHYPMPKILFENGDGDDVKKLCDVGHALGSDYIVIPYLEEGRRKTIDQYKALAVQINKAGEICKSAGLQLGYHNHNFEFLELDGQKGYDVFMNETDKDLLKLELDLYWVVRAGFDPIELFNKQPGRFPLVHIKDMDKADNSKNTEVGNGSIDFKKILTASKIAGVKHYYLEQENNYVPNTTASIQNSFSYIRKKLLK